MTVRLLRVGSYFLRNDARFEPMLVCDISRACGKGLADEVVCGDDSWWVDAFDDVEV